MYRYVAYLRGITPHNPLMRNASLAEHFVQAGFTDIVPFLASGNFLLTHSALATPKQAARRIDAVLADTVGITAATVVRTPTQIAGMVAAKPFGDMAHGKETYLTATFFLDRPTDVIQPGVVMNGGMRLIQYDPAANVLYAVSDQSKSDGADFMRWLEKTHGKAITTRTWMTVLRTHALLEKAT